MTTYRVTMKTVDGHVFSVEVEADNLLNVPKSALHKGVQIIGEPEVVEKNMVNLKVPCFLCGELTLFHPIASPCSAVTVSCSNPKCNASITGDFTRVKNFLLSKVEKEVKPTPPSKPPLPATIPFSFHNAVSPPVIDYLVALRLGYTLEEVRESGTVYMKHGTDGDVIYINSQRPTDYDFNPSTDLNLAYAIHQDFRRRGKHTEHSADVLNSYSELSKVLLSVVFGPRSLHFLYHVPSVLVQDADLISSSKERIRQAIYSLPSIIKGGTGNEPS